MVKNNLTLDKSSDKLLKLLAIENNTSRSAIVRGLIREKALASDGLVKEYAEIIKQNLE